MASRITKKTQVYDQLKRAIISGAIKPGEILNEAELSQQYSIGKTPTREALLLLAHEKLLESIPRVGYVVSRLTITDVLDVYYLRIILEAEAVGLAAERISPEEIALLEENNRAESQLFREKVPGLVSKAYQLNSQFHKMIASASGNARLEQIISELINDLERASSIDPSIADPSQHLEIIESLKAHDKPRAQNAMKTHLAETRMRILNSL
jgi:DNA-binding GntR family transcriptional regulator